MADSFAVEVTCLEQAYGGRPVLTGMSFSAHPGQVTAVLGPNGAGKTTTIECCEGLRRPDAGVVRVLGLDPVADAAALRPRVGVMLQDGGLPTGARAGQFLRHTATLYARPHSPDALIALLGLEEVRRTSVRRLSGGQKQRLALAAAIIGRPEVVFLDEPTAGLDPQARRVVWDVVQRLRADGVTVILTTHFMDEAEQLADHVVVVDAGRVVAEGSPAELTDGGGDALSFQGPAGLDLASLTGALGVGIVADEVTAGRYRVRSLDTSPLDALTVASVTNWCAAHDVMPHGLTLGRRTLEDVFLELTGKALRS